MFVPLPAKPASPKVSCITIENPLSASRNPTTISGAFAKFAKKSLKNSRKSQITHDEFSGTRLIKGSLVF